MYVYMYGPLYCRSFNSSIIYRYIAQLLQKNLIRALIFFCFCLFVLSQLFYLLLYPFRVCIYCFNLIVFLKMFCLYSGIRTEPSNPAFFVKKNRTPNRTFLTERTETTNPNPFFKGSEPWLYKPSWQGYRGSSRHL